MDNVCDGWIDNNRDGSPDPGETDDDGDDVSECGNGPPGGDCDDTDPAIFPGATETFDGMDNNRDGSADEGYSGRVPTAGLDLPGHPRRGRVRQVLWIR